MKEKDDEYEKPKYVKKDKSYEKKDDEYEKPKKDITEKEEPEARHKYRSLYNH
jgi:hypothetical protein